jgi:hypothetical protein
MENEIGYKKPELEVKELALKVRELELKVEDLERPSYKKLSFWTGLITVLIAVIGILGQSILSSIRNEKAELKTEQAAKELTASLARKDSADKAIANAQTNLAVLENRRDSLQKEVDSMSIAFNKIATEVAFSADSAQTPQSQQRLNAVVSETSRSISNILLKNSSPDLLRNSVLKIHYVASTRSKAAEINTLLISKGVKSSYSLPGYDIAAVRENEIVYFNKTQFNYCLAVQSLLRQSGYGNFKIRLSSGANASTQYFKIYLVK